MLKDILCWLGRRVWFSWTWSTNFTSHLHFCGAFYRKVILLAVQEFAIHNVGQGSQVFAESNFMSFGDLRESINKTMVAFH